VQARIRVHVVDRRLPLKVPSITSVSGLFTKRDSVDERSTICLVIRARNPEVLGMHHTLVTGPHVVMRNLIRVDPQLATTRTTIMDEDRCISGKHMVSAVAAGRDWEYVEVVVSVAGDGEVPHPAAMVNRLVTESIYIKQFGSHREPNLGLLG
jgi:hypothetical protein